MLITRTSPVSGTVNTIEVDVTREEYAKYVAGTSIQKAMPHVSAADREFILNGILPEEWDIVCPPEENEEDFEDEEGYHGPKHDNGVSGFDDPNYLIDDTI